MRAHVGDAGGLRAAYRDACEGRLRLLVVDGSRAAPDGTVARFVSSHRAGPVLRIDARRSGALARLVADALSLLSPLRRSRHPARRWLERDACREVLDLQSESERRLRLRDAAVDLLEELGADNPCVLLLDGAERPERALLDVVARLAEPAREFSAHGPPNTPVLTVAVADGTPCERLAALARGPYARRLTLEPLTRDGVQAMLARPEVVDAVFALTGGHPDRLTQLLRHAATASPQAVGGPPSAIARLALIARPVAEAEAAALLFEAGPPGRPLDAAERAVLVHAGASLNGARPEGAAWSLSVVERRRVTTRLTTETKRALQSTLAAALLSAHPVEAAHHALAAEELDLALRAARDGMERLGADLSWLDAAELLEALANAFEAAGRVLPDDLQTRLIDCCWVAGAHDAAIAHARRHHAHHPRRPDTARRLGRLLSYAGRHAEAVALLEQARALSPVDMQLVATLAEVQLREGRLAAARRACEAVLGSALAGRETRVEAEQIRAKVAMAEGQLERAESILHALLADAAASPKAHCQALNNLAIVAMTRGDLSGARAQLDRAVALAERHASVFHRGIALKNLAAVAQLDGRWSDALSAAERALQLLSGIADPSLRARLAFNTADLHRSLGDAYRAGRLCALARRSGPLHPAVHAEGLRVEAAISEELGRHAEALVHWEAACALEPAPCHASEAALGRVRVWTALGRETEAREAMLGLTAPAPARGRARYLACAAHLGGVPEARLAFEAALDTNDPLLVQDARLLLARKLLDAGLEDRAREELAQWRRLDAELLTQVPESMRALFQERRAVRTQLALTERLGSDAPPPIAAPTADGTGMVGSSPAMRRLRSMLTRVGPTEGTVLLTGESGAGKELAAEALHRSSRRAEAAFLRLNCAALVDSLLESELFGHERGAFTGAASQKRGLFERADGGTLLLDEIGDISPRMQAALLRVLQEGTFERVGGTKTLKVDVRILAATHRDLADEVRAGRFREDLYYRLSGITVRVPSLRERRADIEALARHLLAAMASDCGPKTLSPDAAAWLRAHPWPGNVRQLDNVLRRVAVLSTGTLLTADDFETLGQERESRPAPDTSTSLAELAYERVRDGEGSIYELRKRLERELIERALEDADGNISRAAEWLGMKRPRLSKLVNEWGLK